MCRQPIAPNVNAGSGRQPRSPQAPGVARISERTEQVSIRTAYPDIEVAEISTPRFTPRQAGERGAAVPLMGPADRGTAAPLMGTVDRGTAIPLMGPADPGTSTPLMGPADPPNVVSVMGPADRGSATPVMCPAG